MMLHPTPWRVDPEILTIFDANGDAVVSSEIGISPRIHKLQVGNLRRIVASVNLTRFITTEGMEARSSDDLLIAAHLSLDESRVSR